MGRNKDFIVRCDTEDKTPKELEAEKMGGGLNQSDFSDPQAMKLNRLRQAAERVKGMVAGKQGMNG